MEFTTQQLAIRFRTEGARLSRAKHPGMASLYFNASLSLATRCVIFSFYLKIFQLIVFTNFLGFA